MLKNGTLSLMIGPVVPVPVAKEVLDALTDVEVITNTDGPSVFRLNFELSTNSPIHTLFLVAGDKQIPMIRVIIVVTINGQAEVLIDGVMTEHQTQPGSNPATSTLSVTGEDLTKVLDYIDFSGFPFPAMPPFARVKLILAKYEILGIKSRVIPSVLLFTPNPIDQIPCQDGKDLTYINHLAKEAGYVFYHEPDSTPGKSFMYWGPEIKVGTPQAPLNSNMDAHSNVESINFSANTEQAMTPQVWIQNLESKIPVSVPIPDINPLNLLKGKIPPIPKNLESLNDTAKNNPVQAILKGLATSAKAADGVTATGSLDVLRYGRVLKARKLVGVRGVGDPFNGLYYVEKVTSKIKRGEFKQSFNLRRSGFTTAQQALS